jgi:four helix bundle protein
MLPRSRAGVHVADQLLRSGTSPLSNHGEAQAAESRDDFVHKMSICLKELRESLRWLRLVIRVPLVEAPTEATRLLAETEELVRIFKSSIKTAKDNGRKNVER